MLSYSTSTVRSAEDVPRCISTFLFSNGTSTVRVETVPISSISTTLNSDVTWMVRSKVVIGQAALGMRTVLRGLYCSRTA